MHLGISSLESLRSDIVKSMISYTSTWARRRAERSLPKNPRKATSLSLPFYVVYKPREMPCCYLGKWDRKKDAHLAFLKADTPEELWMWLDMHGIYRKHVFDATTPEGLEYFVRKSVYGDVD